MVYVSDVRCSLFVGCCLLGFCLFGCSRVVCWLFVVCLLFEMCCLAFVFGVRCALPVVVIVVCVVVCLLAAVCCLLFAG